MKMTKKIGLYSVAAMIALSFTACGSDNDNNNGETNQPSFTLSATGLANLGANFDYEGWIIVNGNATSAGRFDVNDSNYTMTFNLADLNISESTLDAATNFVLTIEPAEENGTALTEPSDTKILAGGFSGDIATLTVGDSAALGTNFDANTTAGRYIIVTPTDGNTTLNEENGVWWMNFSGGTARNGTPSAGLTLPTLPQGWRYEGWAVIDGNPLSTGIITEVNASDSTATFSGTFAGPNFPGEDFLRNAPSDTNLTFPDNGSLLGQRIVISVEPYPDNSPAPFLLKPLGKNIPTVRAVGTGSPIGSMDNTAEDTNPTATVMR